MEKRLLTEHILSAYYEIVPDPSARAVSLMRKLSAALYDRGARIVIGQVREPVYHEIHHSLDAELRLVWVSKEWGRVLGYRPHEVVGMHAADFCTDDSLRFLREVAMPTLQKGEKIGPVAVTYITRRGEILPGSVRSERMCDTTGAFERTFAKTRIREPLLHPIAATG